MESAADLTCVELTAAYAAREASSVETVHACLQRIADVDSSIQAVITVCADAALEQAALSDERWRTGTARRLEGVPFGVKDIIQTAGIRTTGGSRMYEEYIPEYTATAVERLTDAGAVLLAKVHSWEFAAHGVPFALTRNPWHLAHMAGG
jgi:aspartyl-tRNA(Asn)/glutamyl-tRNA(Gln) amidotransferase subunit A